MQNINRYKKNFFLILITIPLLFNGSKLFTSGENENIQELVQKQIEDQLPKMFIKVEGKPKIMGFDYLNLAKEMSKLSQESERKNAKNVKIIFNLMINAVDSINQVNSFCQQIDKCDDKGQLMSIFYLAQKQRDPMSQKQRDIQKNKMDVLKEEIISESSDLSELKIIIKYQTFSSLIIEIMEQFSQSQLIKDYEGENQGNNQGAEESWLVKKIKEMREENTIFNLPGFEEMLSKKQNIQFNRKKIFQLLQSPVVNLILSQISPEISEALKITIAIIEEGWEKAIEEHSEKSEDEINSSEITTEVCRVLIGKIRDEESELFMLLEKKKLTPKPQVPEFSSEELKKKVAIKDPRVNQKPNGNNGLSAGVGAVGGAVGATALSNQKLLDNFFKSLKPKTSVRNNNNIK